MLADQYHAHFEKSLEHEFYQQEGVILGGWGLKTGSDHKWHMCRQRPPPFLISWSFGFVKTKAVDHLSVTFSGLMIQPSSNFSPRALSNDWSKSGTQ